MPEQHEREDFFKKELVDELKRIVELIHQAPSIEKKAYYFSATYGITSRTYRYSFSKDVLIADLLLQAVYNMLMERIAALKTGDQSVIPDAGIFNTICDELMDLANRFESGDNILEPLENIVTTGFSLTGPGNYLKEKGQLKL